MNIQTEAVAEAVPEAAAEAGVLNDAAGGRIDLAARDAGLRRPDPGKLGIQDDGIDIPHLVGRRADSHGARHIAAVSAFETAEIHGQEIARLQDAVPGDAVGQAGVLSGDDDGIKGVALAAETQHAVDELGCDLLLAHAGTDDLQGLVQRLLADGLGLLHKGDLFGVFGGAKLRHQIPGRHQRQSELLLELRVGGMGELLILGRDLLQLLFLQELLQYRCHRVGVVKLQDGDLRPDRAGGRLGIARVGQKPGLFPGYEDAAVRERKAAGITLVFFVRDEQGLGLCQLFTDACQMIHIPVSSDVGRGKLTTKTDPCGLLLPTSMLPPHCSTASCTMLRPRPLPPPCRPDRSG